MAETTRDELLLEAGRAVAREGRVALCQIVRAEGSTPGKLGWKLLVTASGEPSGNLGGGAFEALVTIDARAQLARSLPAVEVKRYYLTEQAKRGEPTGMVCGGFAEVMIEVIEKRPLLVVCGGGPVGQAIARNAELCGFEILVVDDREPFRDPTLFPEGTRFQEVTKDFESTLDLGQSSQHHVVVVTRCWETDLAALDAVFRSPPSNLIYLGLMGSSRKVERVRSELVGRGYDPDLLELRAPIGLPIGGESPGEIAVSILAEIIQVRNTRSG